MKNKTRLIKNEKNNMGHHTDTRSLIIDKVAHNDPTHRTSGIFREGRQIRPVLPRDNYQFG